jgi:hypothetical protein
MMRAFVLFLAVFVNTIALANGLAITKKPVGFDPNTHMKEIEYFKRGIFPPSMMKVPKATRKMTEDEGRFFYFRSMVPLVRNANNPSPGHSEFERAINEGRVVNPPCATTNSQVMKRAFLNANMEDFAHLFANPHDYYPTHNNEYQLMLLGWKYFLRSEYIAPLGSVGMWSRYTFDRIPGHSGHVFIMFKDGGTGPDLVGDNTRRSGEDHGHPYRMSGSTHGFWLPPGVYPLKRN